MTAPRDQITEPVASDVSVASDASDASDVDLSVPAQRHEVAHGQMATVAVVAVGGAIGAAARYGASLLWPTAPGTFPWTTMTVNAAGCAVIGVFTVVISDVWAAHRLVRPFFGTGVLGGFTTFSTYAVDIQHLAVDGHARTAPLAYLSWYWIWAPPTVGLPATPRT